MQRIMSKPIRRLSDFFNNNLKFKIKENVFLWIYKILFAKNFITNLNNIKVK